jgi:hypothetical protein
LKHSSGKNCPKPTRSRWREPFARQLAATLKETAPEQRISNFECICDALRDRAENGNIKAIKLIFQYLIVPDIRQGISSILDMDGRSLEEKSRLYLDSISNQRDDEDA